MRAHRYVREGRADDADIAEATGDTHEPAVAICLHTKRRLMLGAAAARDTHKPAAIAGLHTPRHAKLAAAPAQRVSRRYSTVP